ncbi:MAG TPA: sugar phosphate nucleotidyltransferase [Acidobacteriaceae bacterium]|nr:sugar phosphate nucleotidyltransferase [Acidobacteriaceae bacterium]
MRACWRDEAPPPLALLAGGLATRLGAMTARVPKSLVEVAGEPFVAHQLRLLAEQGVCDVVMCCGHLGGMIADFVGDGARFGCRVRYSFDGEAALGTGGAIVKALPLLGERFWVMYGDSYLTAEFATVLAAFEAAGRAGLMAVFRNDDRWDASNVEFAAGRILRYVKRSRATHDAPVPGLRHIDYGLGLYSARALVGWNIAGAFDLSLVQGELVARGEMAGFEVRERFYEIGSASGLRETDTFLRERALSGTCA